MDEPPAPTRSDRLQLVLFVAAAFLAAAYALSALTVLFAVGMFVLFRWATKGLEGRERRWILGVLITGLAVRVAALLVLYFRTNPQQQDFNPLFGDAFFSTQRSLTMLNLWSGVDVGPAYWRQSFDVGGSPAFDRTLAVLQYFIGPAPHALPLLSVGAFFGGAVLLYRLVRSSFGRTSAAGGLMLLVFWPSIIAWSISVLKESALLLISAAAIVSAVRLVRASGWGRRLGLAATLLAALSITGFVRVGSDYILGAAIAFGYLVWFSTRHSRAVVLLVSLAMAAAIASATRPALRARVGTVVAAAQYRHIGHVLSEGHSYRAADARFYSCPMVKCHVVSFGEGARFLLKATAYFLSVPLPWQMSSRSEAAFLPELLGWYLMMPFACIGIFTGWPRNPSLTGMLIGYAGAAIAVIAPGSGNIGTVIRHRDMMVPFVVWLAAVGFVGVVSSATRGRLWLIDRAGRVFGWINLADAVPVALVFVLLPLGYVANRLFQERPPTIVSVEPFEQSSGPDSRVRLRGSNFRPSLRAILSPAYRPFGLLNFGSTGGGEGEYVAETATEAEITLPALPAGEYDLHLFDDRYEIARVPSALRLRSPQPGGQRAQLRVRFSAVFDPQPVCKNDDVDVSDRAPEHGSNDSRAAVLKRVGSAMKSRVIIDRTWKGTIWTFDADIDLPVRQGTNRAFVYGQQSIRLGGPFSFETTRYVMHGTVTEMREVAN